MQKRQILINAIMSVVQIIVMSGVLFILYRFLLNIIGVEQLGIWSLVLATTSVSNIANLGLSGSVVKFVAKYIAREEHEKVSRVIQTAAISIALFIGIAVLIGYPVIKWILGLVIPDKNLSLAISILPYTVVSLWIMTITSVFQAGLDGNQRIYLRNILLMGGSILYFLLAIIITPLHGLIGLAYAQIIQNITVLLFSWILLKRYIPLPIIPYQWDKGVFKEIVGYSINFQVISITQMLCDPITKALLSKLGGLSIVGYYEMANRMILQFRALIVSANQVIVPAIADLQEKTPEKIRSAYLTSYRLVFYFAVPLFSLIIICTPLISELWIGHYEKIFVIFAILLSIGWLLNTLSAPAYFSNLGIGTLRWNVMSHIVISVLNIGLGFLLGIFYDGIGIVAAWTISLALGSSVIHISYHLTHKITLLELLPQASRKILVLCLVGIFFSFLIQNRFNHNVNGLLFNGLIIFIFSIIIFFSLWLHPVQRQLMRWIRNELLNRKAEA